MTRVVLSTPAVNNRQTQYNRPENKYKRARRDRSRSQIFAVNYPELPESVITALNPYAFFNFTDVSSLRVNTDGSGGVPALNGTIGRAVGKVNSRDASALTNGQRPTLSTANGRNIALFDGVDDVLAFAVSGLGATAYLAMAFRSTDPVGTFATLLGASTDGRMSTWAQGQSSTQGNDAWINNVPFLTGVGTRNGLALAIINEGNAGRPVVAEVVRNGTGATSCRLLYDPASPGACVSARVFAAIFFTTTPSEANRAIIRQYLSELAGIA